MREDFKYNGRRVLTHFFCPIALLFSTFLKLPHVTTVVVNITRFWPMFTVGTVAFAYIKLMASSVFFAEKASEPQSKQRYPLSLF